MVDKRVGKTTLISKFIKDKTLINLRILHKEYPFGENPIKSRRGIYQISDNSYRFWYRYVFYYKPAIEQGTGRIINAYERL